MAVGLPAGMMVEIEFTAGVWTDVTADVEMQAGLPIRAGRTSPQSQAQISTFTCQLYNQLGKYTPGRQVLADGVTAHPYWPNVLPRKRIRYSYLDGGSTRRYRFTGHIKSWPPALENGVRAVTVIDAVDRMDQLGRVTLQSPIRQEITQDGPVLWWPLTEDASSTSAAEQSGNNGGALVPSGTGAAVTFGDNGPGFGDGTGVKFTPASSSSGMYLTGASVWPAGPAAPQTFSVWFQIAAPPASLRSFFAVNQFTVYGNPAQLFACSVDTAGRFVLRDFGGSTLLTSAGSVADGGWHHVAVVLDPSVAASTPVYLDGVSLGTSGLFSQGAASGSRMQIYVGQSPVGISVYGSELFPGNVGQAAVYLTALSAARVAEHFAAGRGYVGDTTGARIGRYLASAGLTSSDWVLDGGIATVNTYPQAGKSVLQACQDMATTEGGGAAVFIDGIGAVRFVDRRFRRPGPPVMTIDAVKDLDHNVYAPAFDDSTLINTESVDRAAESGTLSTQTYVNAASLAALGGDVLSDSATTYTLSDIDAANLAQYDVNSRATPAFRLPQVAVDLMTAEDNLYAQLGAVLIGSRVRLSNLPVNAAPTTQIDQYVEGWSENPSTDGYQVVFDASPADNPPQMVLDDTSYGRLQCDGQTLNTALTNSATTVVIATASGKPTFTTVSARYPLNIKIGEEVIRLNTAPGGSTSPQTFTAVSRGQQGTTAAGQASGSVVNLWPAAALAL